MPRKTFEEVLTRFREIPIPEDFDLLVAIANGGIIPAAPLNLRLNKEVRPLRINLRAVQRSLLPISRDTLTV